MKHRKISISRRLRLAVAGLCASLAAAGGASAASLEQLFSFNNADGGFPASGFIADSNGNLYGTALGGGQLNGACSAIYAQYPGCGVVYKLTPPAKGQTAWAQSVLYAFQGGADGGNPSGNLVADGHGDLYGTAQFGGANGNGVVFKLTPPASSTGQWTETVLYNFQGGPGDGATPSGDLLIDSAGALYGTTLAGGATNASCTNYLQNYNLTLYVTIAGCGTVFKLTPGSGSQWTETVLYAFQGGADGGLPGTVLTKAPNGVLYGVAAIGGANNQGVLFALTPPTKAGQPWTQSVSFSFPGGAGGANPASGVTLGADGSFYGVAPSAGASLWGVAYKLTPPKSGSGPFTETVIYSFTGQNDGGLPNGMLSFGSNGVLYGQTTLGDINNGGVLFQLAPPSAGTTWTLTSLYEFGWNQNLQPALTAHNSVLVSPSGVLYGPAFMQGNVVDGLRYGGVFQY